MGVIMNYQKFMEIVPKETKDFVFTVLKTYSKYEVEGISQVVRTA